MAAQDVSIKLKAVDETKGAFESVKSSLKGMSAALTSVQGVITTVVSAGLLTKTAELADAYNSVNARLRLVTNGSFELASAQDALFQSAQSTNNSYGATIDLFTSLSRSTRALGVSQSDMIAVTDGINKALAISGANGNSAQAALQQLGQAFAGGALRGEEFNSVSEQAPMILDVLAKGLGKTRGELRAMANDGKITTDVFLKGFTAGMGDLNSQFEKMPTTISGSLTNVNNSIQLMVGKMDAATGASKSVTGGFISIANAISDFGKSVEENKEGFKAIVAFAGAAVGLLAVAGSVGVITGALGALAAVVAANPIIAAIILGGAAAAAAYSYMTGPDANFRGKGFDDPRMIQNIIEAGKMSEEVTKEFQKINDELLKMTKGEQALAVAQFSRLKGATQEQTDQYNALYTQKLRIAALDRELDKASQEADANERQAFQQKVAMFNKQKQIYDETRTPIEAMAIKMAELDKLLQLGVIGWDEYGRAMMNTADMGFPAIKEQGKSAFEEMKDAMRNWGSDFTNVMADMVMTGKGSFSDLANSIIRDLIRIQIQKSITDPLIKAGTSYLDTVFSPSGSTGKAIGGSVQSGQQYLVGERGPEMFIPNQSGSIVPNSDMGGSGVVVNQTINVTTGVQQTVRAEIMSLMPQISNAAKAAVADAKLRGGNYGKMMA